MIQDRINKRPGKNYLLLGGAIGFGFGLLFNSYDLRQERKRTYEESWNNMEEALLQTKIKQIVQIGDLDMNGRDDFIVSDHLGRTYALFGQEDGSYLDLEDAESKLRDCPDELEEFRQKVTDSFLVKVILGDVLDKEENSR